MFTDNELIRKKDIFDPIADDDDIDWKYNPFDVDTIDEVIETPEQLMSQITFEGSTQLQTKLKALVLEFIDVFATKVRREPAAVEPMKIVIDEDKWRLPCNRERDTERDTKASRCTLSTRSYQRISGH